MEKAVVNPIMFDCQLLGNWRAALSLEVAVTLLYVVYTVYKLYI